MAGGGNASKATKDAATKFHSEHPYQVYFFLGALILAYFAKYFCTSFIYISQKMWQKDQGISEHDLSTMFICGYVMSMIGKRAAGNWADKWGGKNVQMLSLCVYIPVVIVWSFGDRICDLLGLSYRFPLYLFIWLFNGFFALGLSWVAIMVCASNWMPPHMEGRLLAVVGCAPELGDASARAFLGPIIKNGWGGITLLGFGAAGHWPTVTLSAALAGIVLSIPMFVFVRESPLGYEEEKQQHIKSSGGQHPLDQTLMALTCTMCGLLYAIRTMFLLYSVTWLDTVYCTYYPTDDMDACESSHVTQGNTATASLLFTFFGMFSVLLCGQLKDSIAKKNRGYLLLANAVILLLVTSIMKIWDTSLPFPLAVFLVGMIGFGNFGPYKTMSGAFAVDIGGKSRKGDVTAWMGVASNGCAAIIILVKGFLSGWSEMFVILVVLSIGCIACSVLILMYDAKKAEETSVSAKPLLA